MRALAVTMACIQALGAAFNLYAVCLSKEKLLAPSTSEEGVKRAACLLAAVICAVTAWCLL